MIMVERSANKSPSSRAPGDSENGENPLVQRRAIELMGKDQGYSSSLPSE